jgi:hypothetical protein
VRVTPNDGTVDGLAVTSAAVTIVNSAPTVTLVGVNSADEGQTKHYTFTVVDPDSGDMFTLVSGSCGLYGSLTGAAFTSATGAGSFDCTFPDGPNSSTVSVQVKDSDSANSNISSIGVTVNNVKPTVTILTGDSSANEGQTKTYTYSVTDPGADTITVTESCGANGIQQAESPAVANSFDCLFPDGPATSTVKVTANDEDPGPATEATRLVTIANVKPVVLTAAITVDSVTGTISSTMTYSDAGVNDTQAATFEYRLNGVLVATHTSAPTLPSSGTATDTYRAAPGCYSVEVTMWVTDKDGASADHVVKTGATSLVDIYAASFQAPIKDNERNIAKYGNVVPVKVELRSSCSGATVTTPILHITIAAGNVADIEPDATPVIVAESVSNADTGTQMRINGGGYIYNFTTKNLTQGQDYTIRIRVGSPTGPIILRALFQPKK